MGTPTAGGTVRAKWAAAQSLPLAPCLHFSWSTNRREREKKKAERSKKNRERTDNACGGSGWVEVLFRYADQRLAICREDPVPQPARG
jgi:hypothetical protein